MKRIAGIVSAALMIVLLGNAAHAADNAKTAKTKEVRVEIAKANEASQTFTNTCLRHIGERNAIYSVVKPLIEAKIAYAERSLARLNDPRVKEAYNITTPSGANLLLMLGEKRYCALLVSDADPAALRTFAAASVKTMADALKAKLITLPVKNAEDKGAKVTLETYKLLLPNKGTAAPTITVSTADKAVYGKQHLLTFYIGKKPAIQ